MKLFKLTALTAFLLAVFFIYKTSVLAVVVTETSGDLQVTYNSPLFEPAILWYPSLEEIRDFKVKNLGSKTHTVYIQSTNESQSGNLASVFFTRFIQGGSNLYGSSDSKTMDQFFTDGQINLSDLTNGQEKQYDMAIKFWQGAGNEYQGKQAKFDLIVGFKGEKEQVVIEGGGTDDGGTDDGGTDDGGGDDGGGDDGVGGTDASAASPAPSPLQTTAYTPFAEVAGGEVAGETIEEEPDTSVKGVEDKPEVKGAACSPWQSWWWLPLIFQFAITVIYYWLTREKKIYLWWFLPMIISAISQLVHQLWWGCECADTVWCQRYWLLNLGILLITSSYFKAKLFLKQPNAN